jgi:PAS domain S-box-containing protein
MKTEDVKAWRHERLGDASLFYRNAGFTALVQQYFDDPKNVNAQNRVQAWLSGVAIHSECDRAILLDVFGRERMSVPPKDEPVDVPILQMAQEVMESGQIGFQDFYVCEYEQKIYLGTVTPIFAESGNQKIGVLVLCIDPEIKLFPDINKWPARDQTGEIVLVRREGNDALFLNELKFRKDAALSFRVSLDENKDIPAVKAALGQEGIVEGIDYRGVPVIASIRTIPNSPWFLVAKMDISEAYAPIRDRIWALAWLIGVLLLGMGVSLWLIWRQRRMQYYREKSEAAETLRESEERYRTVANYTFDWEYWLAPDGNLIYVSPACEAITGYRPEEFQQDPGLMVAIVHPEDRESVAEHMEQVNTNSCAMNFELDYRILTRSGEEKWIAHACRKVFSESGQYLGRRASNRDITGRKQAEKSLREYNDKFNKLSFNVPGVIYQFTRRPDGTFYMPFATEAIKDIFGCSPQDVCEDFSPIAGVILPEDFDRVIDSIEYSAKHLTNWICEFRVQIPGQSIRWISGNSTPEKMPDGSITWFGFSTDITERRKVDQILKESEERFRSIAENTGDGIGLVDLDDHFIYANKVAEQVFGVAERGLVGHGVREFIDDKQYEYIQTVFLNRQAGQSTSYQLEITQFDGARRIINVTSTTRFDASGNPIGSYGIFRDVTELKQAEQALKKSEERFRSLLENAMDLISVFDAKGNILFQSPSAERILGYKPGELIGDSVYNYIHPDDLRRVIRVFVKGARREGNIVSIEFRFKHKNGSWTALESIGQNLLSIEAISGIVVNSRDITERKRAEERLLELKLAVEQAADGIAMADLEGNIKFVNGAWAKMHGYSADEIIGKHLNMFHTEEQIQNEVAPFIEVLMVVGFREGEVGHVRKDGNIFQTWMSSSLLKDANQKPIGLLGVARDITKQKRLEEMAISSDKMAAIGQLAAGVAHEFNNLLGGIMGNLSLALEYPEDNILTRSSMAESLKATEQAAELVQSLLSYSRQDMIRMTDVNVENVFDNIIKLTGKDIKMKAINLITEFKDVALVWGNQGQIQQVFLNMLINATHAVSNGGTIKLSARSDGRKTYIEFADDGIGIEPENLSKIFDPFFSTKGVWGENSLKGTGLGLSICQNIIKDHNGEIRVSSIPNKGTTFTIVLPNKEDAGHLISGNFNLKGKIALAFEFDREQAASLAKIFAGQGGECSVCSWSNEAMDILGAGRFDYAILDANHPALADFSKLFEYIKTTFPNIMIFLSSSGPIHYLLDEYLYQSDGVIFKPYSVENISEAFSKIINNIPQNDKAK